MSLGENVLGRNARIAIGNQLQERTILAVAHDRSGELVLDLSFEGVVRSSGCVRDLASQVKGE